MTSNKVTLQTVRKSYKQSVMRTFPFTARWIGRPLADILAVPIHNFGLTANGITGFRIFLYFVSISALFVPNFLTTVLGALGLLIAFVLDFVDGHLARLQNQASFFGKFFDGIGDYLFPVFLTLPIAIRVDLGTGNLFYSTLSFLCVAIILINRMVRERSRYFLAVLPKKFVDINAGNLILKRVQKLENLLATHAANTRILLIFILFIPGAELLYLIAMLVCQLVLEPIWLCLILYNSYLALNHWRKSASAA